MADVWPVEVRLVAGRSALSIVFDSGETATLPAELLRCESPSAEVQGHSAGGKTLVAGKRDVLITSIEPIGNYAIRLVFDDGHSTGLYGWTYLSQLAADPDGLLRDYRRRLAEAGSSPDPAGPG